MSIAIRTCNEPGCGVIVGNAIVKGHEKCSRHGSSPARIRVRPVLHQRSTVRARHLPTGNGLTDLEREVSETFALTKSYREVAAIVGCSIKAVDNALQRARRKLAILRETAA